MTDSVSAADGAERFQVLALDGGGAKALFSAHVLARLEADLQVRIADSFDLVTGTSAGGIIALALGAGLRPGRDRRRVRAPGGDRVSPRPTPVVAVPGPAHAPQLRRVRSPQLPSTTSSASACWETARSGSSSRPGMFTRAAFTSSRRRTMSGCAATGGSRW